MKIQQYCSSKDEREKLEDWIYHLERGQGPFQFQTSGSTGVPKLISFSWNQLKTSVLQTQKAFNLTSSDVFLCPFSLNYVAGKMMVTRAFMLDAKLTFTGPSRNPLLHKEVNPTFIALVPLQLEAVIDNPVSLKKLNQAKAIIIGGAPMNKSLEKRISLLVKAPIYQTYGMTETLTHVAIRNVSKSGYSDRFKALSGVTFQQNPDGCLIVKTPINNAPIQTNDMVELFGSSFKWLGRIDWVINSGGFKIHPEKVEQALESIGTEDEVLVCGVPDDVLGELALAMATFTYSENKLKSLVPVVLHKYEMPKLWYKVNTLPRLSNGKVDRLTAKRLALDAVRNGEVKKVS